MIRLKFVFAALTILFFAGNLAHAVGIDEAAPDFKLTDSKGKTVSLSEFRDKYVVLEWINYDCPFVKKHYESSNMQNLQKEFASKGVVWLSICSSAPGKQGNFSVEELNRRMDKLQVHPYAYLLDPTGEVGKLYGAKTTPDIRIINPKGILIYAGAIDDIPSTDQADITKANNYVRQVLDAAMNSRDIPVKATKSYGCSVKY